MPCQSEDGESVRARAEGDLEWRLCPGGSEPRRSCSPSPRWGAEDPSLLEFRMRYDGFGVAEGGTSGKGGRVTGAGDLRVSKREGPLCLDDPVGWGSVTGTVRHCPLSRSIVKGERYARDGPRSPS